MALLYTCSVNCTASHFKRGGLPLLANTQLRLLSTDRFVPFYAVTCNCVVTSVCVFTFGALNYSYRRHCTSVVCPGQS